MLAHCCGFGTCVWTDVGSTQPRLWDPLPWWHGSQERPQRPVGSPSTLARGVGPLRFGPTRSPVLWISAVQRERTGLAATWMRATWTRDSDVSPTTGLLQSSSGPLGGQVPSALRLPSAAPATQPSSVIPTAAGRGPENHDIIFLFPRLLDLIDYLHVDIVLLHVPVRKLNTLVGVA